MPIETSVRQRYESEDISVMLMEHQWTQGCAHSEINNRHVLHWRCSEPRQELRSSLAREGMAANGYIGRLLFIPAGIDFQTQPHPHAGASKVFRLYFGSSGPQRPDLPNSWRSADLNRCFNVGRERLDLLFRYLSAEVAYPSFGSTEIVRSLCGATFVELMRHFRLLPKRQGLTPTEGRFGTRDISRITDYIRSSDQEKVTIANIASEFGMSAGHMSRIFKATTGNTICNYISQITACRARDLLAGSDMSLKEIAYALGFSDVSAFSRAYFKETGERPGSYRASCRAEQTAVS
jgi:AraC family transcriptional regulator